TLTCPELWQMVKQHYGNDLGLNNEEMANLQVSPESSGQTSKVQVSYWTDASQSVSPSVPHSLLTSMLTRTCRSKVARKALKKVEQASKDASHFSLLSFLFIMLLSFLPPPVEDRIGRSEELGRLFVNRVFHISANKMFELLFTDSSFTRRFMDIRRISSRALNPFLSY
ncbi:hypothetical protein XENOCAPTIV_012010, partial [Xenoophorus captivus]